MKHRRNALQGAARKVRVKAASGEVLRLEVAICLGAPALMQVNEARNGESMMA